MMKYQFKPKLIPTVVFLALFPILLSLGFWQLDRAQEKRDILEALEISRTGAPLSLNAILADPRTVHYQGIEITGKFVPESDMLLMHQMHGNQHGYQVLTVFEIARDQPRVLVNRGFIEKDSKLNIPAAPIQNMTIYGIIDLPKPDRFILGDNILEPAQKPLEMQRVDLRELSEITGQNFEPIVVLANTDLNDGLVRDWQIITTMPPEKHIGYAIQWFALALCLMVIYMVVNIKKG